MNFMNKNLSTRTKIVVKFLRERLFWSCDFYFNDHDLFQTWYSNYAFSISGFTAVLISIFPEFLLFSSTFCLSSNETSTCFFSDYWKDFWRKNVISWIFFQSIFKHKTVYFSFKKFILTILMLLQQFKKTMTATFVLTVPVFFINKIST